MKYAEWNWAQEGKISYRGVYVSFKDQLHAYSNKVMHVKDHCFFPIIFCSFIFLSKKSSSGAGSGHLVQDRKYSGVNIATPMVH